MTRLPSGFLRLCPALSWMLCVAQVQALPLELSALQAPPGEVARARVAKTADSSAVESTPPGSAAASISPAPPTLRLETLLTGLLARNPEISARVELREAERAREQRARTLPDPTVQIMGENFPFGAGMASGSQDRATATGSAGTPPMIAYQLSQMLMFPGKRALMAREAAAGVEMAGADLEQSRQDLVASGRQMFYALYLNAQARRLNLASQQLVGQLHQLALSRYGAGLDAHHDVLRAQVELQSFENERITLDQQRQSVVALINAWLDQPIGTPLGEPEAVFSAPRRLDPAELEAYALAHRPELQQMAAMVQQEEAMADLARREYYPDLMVMGSYQQMFGEMDMWGAAVSFTIPIRLGKKQALEVREKQRRAEAARKSLEAMRAMVRFEVQDARLKVETAERRITLLEKTLLPKAEEALSALMASYRAGKLDFISLLESRRTLQELQLGLEQARVEREQRLADLDRAVGTSLERIVR